MATPKQSSEGHGGKRPGSGRKPTTLKGIVAKLPADSAKLVLAEINADRKWVDLASSDDENIVLKTLCYLTDRAFGKAAQAVDMNLKGNLGVQLVSDIPRPARD